MITYDNSGQSTNFSAGTCTFSFTNAGNYLFVNALNAASVTFNGVGMSILQTYTPTLPPFGANCPTITVWGLANPLIGTANIVVTLIAQADVTCASYFGVDSGVQPDVSTTNDTHAGQTIGLNASVTTTVDGDWIVGFIRGSNNSPRNWVAQAGTTMRQGGSALLGQDACAIFDLNTSESIGTYTTGANWSSSSGFSTMITMGIVPGNIGGTFVGQMIIL